MEYSSNRQTERGTPPLSRRGWLVGLIGMFATAASGSLGLAFGYKYRADIRSLKMSLMASPLQPPVGLGEFNSQAEAIYVRLQNQTKEMVTHLKKKYEHPIFGKTRLWNLIQKSAHCIDPTDKGLYCASQLTHMQQVLAGMEHNKIKAPDLLVAAMVHDLGKLLLLTGEVPENVVCPVQRLEEAQSGVGLDNLVFQFGHAEFIYSRLKDHIPEHLAWLLRYHNIDPQKTHLFMDRRDHEYTEKYLIPFSRFDNGFKSPYFLPRVSINQYRDLIEEYFPNPILF